MSDRDDLDDILDDALKDYDSIDQHRSTAAPPSNPAPAPKPSPAPSAARPTAAAGAAESPVPGGEPGTEQATMAFARDMQAILDEFSKDDLLKNLTQKLDNPKANPDDLRATLEKLTANIENMQDSQAGESDALLDKILDDLEKDSDNPEGGGLMEGMMKQLLAKSVLYEPLKDLRDKYPLWLEQNDTKLNDADRLRFKEQLRILREITQIYESEGDQSYQKLVDLMQMMQEQGQPPADIVRGMVPGAEFGTDGFPMLPNFGGDGDKSACSLM